jgi:hypothetical protein
MVDGQAVVPEDGRANDPHVTEGGNVDGVVARPSTEPLFSPSPPTHNGDHVCIIAARGETGVPRGLAFRRHLAGRALAAKVSGHPCTQLFVG